MAEEIKDGNTKPQPTVADQKAQLPPQPQPTTLIITLTPDGNLSVDGPGNGQMYDEMLCDFMMKKASRYIEAHNFRVMQPRIQPIRQPTMVERVRGMFNKRR